MKVLCSHSNILYIHRGGPGPQSHLGDAETALEMIADEFIGQDPGLMEEVGANCAALDAAGGWTSCESSCDP